MCIFHFNEPNQKYGQVLGQRVILGQVIVRIVFISENETNTNMNSIQSQNQNEYE